MSRRVVITGMGVYCPLGNDVETTWQNAVQGVSGIRLLPELAEHDLKTQIGGQVQGFDANELFGRRNARRMDRMGQLMLAASMQALEDAGLSATESDRDRIGVVMGSGIGGIGATIESITTFHDKGPSRMSPFFIPMMLPDSAPGTVAIEFGFRGPNMSIATACASANNAMGEAARMIRQGDADVVLTGGAEAALYPEIVAGFNSMGALSTRNDNPQGASSPFDLNRDGFVPAEGAAVLVFETLERAIARNAPIYAEFLGYGASADAFHISSPAEDGGGAILSMQRALDSAGLTIGDVDCINAHGTSTNLNDKTETLAIKRLFGERAYEIPISSTKGVHGHLLGAAGALEAVIAVKTIMVGVIPPTANLETPDPECDLDYVPNQARELPVGRIMSNSFGFGGHNATIILGRYP